MNCGYMLRGLPEPVCPECGRAFDPADPTTYRCPRVSTGFRLTPLQLASIGLAVYIGCLVAIGCLEAKGTVSMSIHPVLIVAGAVTPIIAIMRAFKKREQRVGTVVISAFLLLIVLTIHLPSYLGLIEEIAAVRAISPQFSTGGTVKPVAMQCSRVGIARQSGCS